MASSTYTQSKSFRRGLTERLTRFRRKFQHASGDACTPSVQKPDTHQHVASQSVPHPIWQIPAKQTSSTDLKIRLRADGESAESIITGELGAQIRPGQTRLHSDHTLVSIHQSTLNVKNGESNVSSDLWSAAYREAVESFGKDVDAAILVGTNAAQLFTELESIDKGTSEQSVFLRGVAYLRSIQVPLERFKLALDLASPLASIDPAASSVVGVVRSVTAIAISFASADLEFARQIGEMLEQISYIDDCDTLGQRINKAGIHKALVLVYQKILEFYRHAHEILTQRGRKLAMKMILETDRLPNIIQDFLRHADTLRKLIENSTLEIVEDIKTMLYDREIARWLDSTRMIQQTQYHNRLQGLRSDEACKFLLTHPTFTHWCNAPDSQQLLILGEMGCGKSVAMTFLVDELNQRNGCQIPRPKVCYYYCRDETDQAVSILSGLILALLEQLSGLKKTFYEWYKGNQASGILNPAASATKLGEFIDMVLTTFDRTLFIVIDGLDECDRTSRRKLLQVLGNLLKKTPRLKVLLSSRPEEEILTQLTQTSKIALESNVDRDTVIVRHTVQEQLFYLSEDVRRLVVETLSRSAQGSAIWTKMTVELIQVRNITALAPMRTFLTSMSLPGQLSELYTTLLSRNSSKDPENEELAALALKILAAACRPLSIHEITWGVALAAAHHEISTVAALAQLVDHKRVMGLITPFITRVDFADLRKRQVRLVHQSVTEFVVRDLSYFKGFDTSTMSSPPARGLLIEGLEAFMLDICIKYLLLQEVGTVPLFSDEQIAIDELPQEADLFSERKSFEYDVTCTWEVWEEDMICYDPTERGFGEFFVYASSQWLRHFGAIEKGPLPRVKKLEMLCQAGSMRLDNWTNQNCRPGCAIKARFDFESHLHDPLSITSLYGSDAVLRDMLQNSNFEKETYLPSSFTNAADQILLWGNLSKLKILFFEGKTRYQLRNLEFFRLVINRWYRFSSRHDNWAEVFDLVYNVLDELVNEQWGNELLCIAAGAGCLPMIERLLDRAHHMKELRTELWRNSRPIGEAVLGNHVAVVECLLRETSPDLELQSLDPRGESLLHMASTYCNPAMFGLLIPRVRSVVNQVDSHGDTALIRTIRGDTGGRYEVVKILLPYIKADRTAQIVGGQQDALRLAAELDDEEMCRLLAC